MSKKLARIPVSYESGMNSEEMLYKLEQTLAEQKEAQLYKQKGKPVFLWEKQDEHILLCYHQNYKKDMGDTAFKGQIKKGLAGCQLDGFICKPRGVWVVFWCIAIIFAAMFTALPIILSQNPDIPMYYALPFVTFAGLAAYILVSMLMFDRKRLKILNDFLRDFTVAKNTDALGEEIEEELKARGR